jgi:DNA ligase (NAD+)
MNKLEKLIYKARYTYYNTSSPIMTDEEYDKYIEELKEKKPDSILLKQVGTEQISGKVKLPYWLGSLNKIKKDKIDSWAITQNSPFVITDKLDGVSALLHNNKLYTRGNGIYGSDITHLLKHIINIPKLSENITVRGELIMKSTIFNNHYKDKFKNARNLVAGIINSKNPDISAVNHIDFIVYELINPIEPFDTGLIKCKNIGFTIVNSIKTSIVSVELLSSILKDRKNHSLYDIDGIVITTNNYVRNTSDNPTYSIAYKENTTSVSSEVIRVVWNISKDGYIKPIVIIKPITISGIVIRKVNGYNAKFIKENNIGKSAIVEIVRSGDVIPNIVSVIKPAKSPQMPIYSYIWNETNVDIMLENPEDSDEVKIKKLQKFFNSYDNIKGIKNKTIEKFYSHGIKTIKDYLMLSMDKLLSIDRIDVKSANNILTNINLLKKEMNFIPKLMAASGCYSRGIGEERFKSIMDVYPSYLTEHTKWSYDEFIQKIIDIPQWQIKTAEQLYNHNDQFIEFFNDIKPLLINDNAPYDNSEKKIVVFTGFRDKNLQKEFESKNWIVKDSVNKKVSLIIRPDDNYISSNVKKGINYGIKIINKNNLENYNELFRVDK